MQRRYPPGGPPRDEAYLTPPVSGGRLAVPPENAEAGRQPLPRFADAVAVRTSSMMRVAAALVGMADAEDAAQEALLRAWQAWGTLRDPGALRPWLLRITVNVCRGWRRGSFGRQTSHEYPLPDEDSAGMELLAVVSGGPGTSDHTGALDLRRAVDHLSTEFRVVVVLRYYAGMDATEIGAALGIPPTTVRTRLHRALLHRALLLLRERLQVAGVVVPRSVWPRGDIE